MFSAALGVDGLSEGELAVFIAVLTLTGTLLVAVIGAWATLASTKRENRRVLYSEAVRAALAWEEMVFRVRRRSEDQTQELIARFHKMQDDLAYYSAWIGSDSKSMRRSYQRLVGSVKSETEQLITRAWEEQLRKPPGNKLPDDAMPNLGDVTDPFLNDVRAHLSPWIWPRICVWHRNRNQVS